MIAAETEVVKRVLRIRADSLPQRPAAAERVAVWHRSNAACDGARRR